MDKTEKRICWYSSLLIALLVSSPRLLALRENGIVAHYWRFNLAELILQVALNLYFCYLLFHLNLHRSNTFFNYRSQKRYIIALFLNLVLVLTCCIFAGAIQHRLFLSHQLPQIYWSGYISRYFLSGMLAAIIIKIVLLLRESKQKDSENDQLKTAYLEAELELLKEQLNPHFLFNSLSTLSGVVREDPVKAQHFINHLSKIFRYALTQSGGQMATIEEELKMVRSYEQLLIMRFEDAFKLNINVDAKFLGEKIPHLSLQPLVENAAKHNSVTLSSPLAVQIFIEDSMLVIRNNLQVLANPESSTGIGLVNLASRYRILMQQELIIEKTTENFIIKLPLKL
ncbi:sensor histidine kinase [Mucilaginibacter flavidus]|uniref:sensor histidine kinase n=1 Tax=Mucilaginibacter flavidus TaxID=2949309 RepID=UPI002093DCD7|nr:histidine kinase [Mucilaginibacter flavidus]MCO5947916.1 histidine kinase [Mucilaginibacter flavidus]